MTVVKRAVQDVLGGWVQYNNNISSEELCVLKWNLLAPCSVVLYHRERLLVTDCCVCLSLVCP